MVKYSTNIIIRVDDDVEQRPHTLTNTYTFVATGTIFEFNHLKYGKITFVSLRNFIFLSFYFQMCIPLPAVPISNSNEMQSSHSRSTRSHSQRFRFCSTADIHDGKKEEANISGFRLCREKNFECFEIIMKKTPNPIINLPPFFVCHSLTTLGDFYFDKIPFCETIRIKWSQLMII